jgi:hypothetical protein
LPPATTSRRQMRAVGAESGAVSLARIHGLGRPSCVFAPATRYPVGSKPNRRFRRLTCLRLVGTGLIVGAPPPELPGPAFRMRPRTPSGTAVLAGFTTLYRQLQPCDRARAGCFDLVWRSARKWIHPANTYARKITKTIPTAARANPTSENARRERRTY